MLLQLSALRQLVTTKEQLSTLSQQVATKELLSALVQQVATKDVPFSSASPSAVYNLLASRSVREHDDLPLPPIEHLEPLLSSLDGALL